jgi:hypothetical protein
MFAFINEKTIKIMAKRSKNVNTETMKSWREGELIDTFNLNRIITTQTTLMQEWLDVQMPELIKRIC